MQFPTNNVPYFCHGGSAQQDPAGGLTPKELYMQLPTNNVSYFCHGDSAQQDPAGGLTPKEL